MSKIRVKTMLWNKKENKYYSCDVIGIRSNKIKFIFDGIVNLITLGDIINYKRTCDDYEIEMSFDLNSITTGKYVVKGLGYFNLKIETVKLVNKNNYLEIDYIMDLEGEKTAFNYIVEMEDL